MWQVLSAINFIDVFVCASNASIGTFDIDGVICFDIASQLRLNAFLQTLRAHSLSTLYRCRVFHIWRSDTHRHTPTIWFGLNWWFGQINCVCAVLWICSNELFLLPHCSHESTHKTNYSIFAIVCAILSFEWPSFVRTIKRYEFDWFDEDVVDRDGKNSAAKNQWEKWERAK